MTDRPLTEIEKEFLPVGKHRGGIFLLKPEDALRFIDRNFEKGFALYGVDGFFSDDDSNVIQPDQDYSSDGIPTLPESEFVAEIKRLVSSWLGIPRLWVEVVTSESSIK